MIFCGMLALCRMILWAVVDLFRPRAALEAEILVLRQQIVVLRRANRAVCDRMLLGWVCHLCPKARGALAIVRPDTVVRWHRVGLRCYWRWKSSRRRGHPGVPAEIRQKLLGDDWLTRMDESGWRIQRPAARATPQHAADIVLRVPIIE